MADYSALICGLGSIGALKPDAYDYPGRTPALTHAHALYANGHFDRIALYDSSEERTSRALAKWPGTTSVYGEASLAEYLRERKPEVVIIATPTSTHYEMVCRILDICAPPVLIIEKPCGNSFEQCFKMSERLSSKGTKTIVNYTRRFEKYHQAVKAALDQKTYGEIQQCRCIYTRGLYREASHAVDLFNWWFGGIVDCMEIVFGHDRASWNDGEPLDVTISAALCYKRCPHVFLTPADGRNYAIFEIDILCEKARVRLDLNGRFLSITTPDQSTYGPYMQMPIAGRYEETELIDVLGSLYRHVIDCLETDAQPACTIYDALYVHDVLEMIKSRRRP